MKKTLSIAAMFLGVLMLVSAATTRGEQGSSAAESVTDGTPSAEAILSAASNALSAAAPMRFDFRLHKTQGDRTSIFVGEGLSAPISGERRRVRLDGERSDGPVRDGSDGKLAVIDDGSTVTVLDHGEQVQWSSPLYRAGGILFQVWAGKFMNSIVAPDALPPLMGLGPTVLADESVEGQLCHVLELPIPGGITGTVYVGRADGLPRRAVLEADGFRSQTDLSKWRPADETAVAEAFNIEKMEQFTKREFTLGGPAPGDAAPPFELTAANGSTITSSQLDGKVVILDFWATWCIPCRASMTELQELHAEYGDRPLEIVSVTYQESGDPAALIEELGITYPWYGGDSIAPVYGVDQSGLPTMFLIGRDGRIRDFFYGYTGEESAARLRQAVDAALADS